MVDKSPVEEAAVVVDEGLAASVRLRAPDRMQDLVVDDRGAVIFVAMFLHPVLIGVGQPGCWMASTQTQNSVLGR